MTLRAGELRASDLVSLVLNPSVLTACFFCLLAAHCEPPGVRLILHDVVGVAFTAVIPVVTLFLLKSTGRLSDLEMRVRSERSLVFAIGAATYGLGTALLWITDAPWPLWGILALHVTNSLVLIGANRILKVSVHTMVLTSLAAAALMFLGKTWLPAVLLVPAAAWARWDAGNHSVTELVWGVLIGGLMTPIELLALAAVTGGRL
jgi:hypothetical protein